MRKIHIAVAAVSLLGGVAACGTGTSGSGDSASGGSAKKTIVVGSAAFPESVLLGNIYAEALKGKGFEVTTKFEIGAREAYIEALKKGDISLVPDYSGNLLAYLKPDATQVSAADVAAALPGLLTAAGLGSGAVAPAEDKDSVTVTEKLAKEKGLTTIADLKKLGSSVRYGTAPEFETRPDGVKGIQAKYGVTLSVVPFSDYGGPLTLKALKSGDVSAANIYTTTPALKTEGLVVLKDPDNNFRAQSVLPVFNKKVASADMVAVLDAVSAKLTTDVLIDLNAKVSGDKKVEPREAAHDWLKASGLL